MNNLEYKIGTILNELEIIWAYETIFTCNNKTYVPDFFIKDKKIIIECYGDYWHCNPLIFSEQSKIFRKISAKQIWEKDRLRKENFEKEGYRFISIWESETKDLEKLKERIKQCLNI